MSKQQEQGITLAQEQQSQSLVVRDPAAVAAAEASRARIESAFIMALRKPRDEDRARQRIIVQMRNPGLAARVEYSKPVGGSSIKGPSIRFAEVALREWGNILCETAVLYEDQEARRLRVSVLDLETNASHSREIQIRKTVERREVPRDRQVIASRTNSTGQKVFIVAATDDEVANKEAAAISKVLRNEGLRLLPADVVDDAMREAKRTLAKAQKEDPEGTKNLVLDAFLELGITVEQVVEVLGHPIEYSDLEQLRQWGAGIKGGDTTWRELREAELAKRAPKPEPGQEAAGKGSQALVDALSKKHRGRAAVVEAKDGELPLEGSQP